MAATENQKAFYTNLLHAYRGGTLKRGASGRTVRALQLFLADKGYDVGKADGVFGRQTEAALRSWQKAEGLSSDGQAGRRSLTRMRESTTPLPKQRPSAPPPAFKKPAAVAPRPSTLPGAGIAPTPLSASLGGVPTGVGAEEGMFDAARQVGDTAAAATVPNEAQLASGVGMDRVMQGPAPGVLDASYPVGAGGARPDPTRRPLPGAVPPDPPLPATGIGSDTGLAQALAGGGTPVDEENPYDRAMEGPVEPMQEPMPPQPMSMPYPEGAMQLSQLPPLNRGGGAFPQSAPATNDLLSAMTPEDIALIQALLQQRAMSPGQTPPMM